MPPHTMLEILTSIIENRVSCGPGREVDNAREVAVIIFEALRNYPTASMERAAKREIERQIELAHDSYDPAKHSYSEGDGALILKAMLEAAQENRP